MKNFFKRVFKFYKKIFSSSESYGKYIGVKLGEGCRLGKVDFGTEPYLISIGDNVQITDNVKFFTHGGAWVFRKIDKDFDFFGEIKIKNNVYIGNNICIMPGVTIGNNVLIGAGSVITKSIADNCIVAGNPGRIIGEYQELYSKLKRHNTNTKSFNFEKKRDFLLNNGSDYFITK